MSFWKEMTQNKDYTYKGKKLYKGEGIEDIGEYHIKLIFVSSNSKYRQGISFSMFMMKGFIKVDNETIKKGGMYLWEDHSPKEIEFDVKIDSGALHIIHFCDNTGTGSRVSGNGNFAMMKERISETRVRYYCNDIAPDDDFDDLIFELEITPIYS
ncbi:MAG: hypothetical protein KKH01_07645 [Firmicutes bacterium]|nr:hypothetical protein [Bacillota bacterium]